MKTFEECQADELYYKIPESTIRTINDYVVHKLPPGSFVQAVLENNLSEAIGRADHLNIRVLKEIVTYIYNEIPSMCWKSPEHVARWLNPPKEEEDGEQNTEDLNVNG